VAHIDEGLLRRLCDEPLAVEPAQRQHLQTCAICSEQLRIIRADADQAGALLGIPAQGLNTASAWSSLQERIANERIPAYRSGWQSRLTGRGFARPVGIVAGTVLLASLVAWTPARALGQNFISMFQPKQVQALPVTQGELSGLSNLRNYGTVHAPKQLPVHRATSLPAAASETGMTVLKPGTLPQSIGSRVSYQVIPGATGWFQFSVAKARRAAGNKAPAMPPGLDGSTLRLTTGTAVVSVYRTLGDSTPTLIIGQMKAPHVATTGVSVQQLRDYLLTLPGVSSRLANEVRALGDPTATLPIPVLIDRTYAHTVTVQGVQGLAIGDSTGLGSGVVWEKDGIVYGAGGPLTEDQIMSIVQSLHA